MEFLRKLFVQTQSHLKGMTLSQRLAIVSCVGLIALALLWLMSWSAEPEMVPLLNQAMTAQELTPIQEQLDARGVKYKVVGSSLLVPAAKRLELQAQLAQVDALPDDISITFKTMIEDSSPWTSMAEQSRRWSVALGNELSRVVRGFDGVREARVILDKTTKRMIGEPNVKPTASVYVRMSPSQKLDQNRVHALASFVSSSVAGLDISNVRIVDATGMSYSVPEAENGLAFDDLNDRRNKELYFAQQIKGLLAHIPGLLVAVHAELDPKFEQITKEEHGKPAMTKDKSESLTQESGGSASEPGVVGNVTPNAGFAARGTGDKTEKSSTETTFDGKTDTIRTQSETPRHSLKGLSASVNVPRSYLAEIYKQQNDGKEPSDKELDTAAKAEDGTLAKIERQANRALGVPDDADSIVAVDWFHDGATMALEGQLVGVGAGDDLMTYVRQYGSKAGLGALAVMSLAMMLMMVRKVGEGPVLPGEEAPTPRVRIVRGGKRGGPGEEENVEHMEVADMPVGEAEVSEHLLVGREVDEKILRTQKVIEQVGDLVREDVESSANILQKWITAGMK